MSVQAMSWVIDNSKHSLGSLIVLLMLANHMRSDGTGAWPSIATLAKESRLSEREVRYVLRKLEESGELETEFAAGPHGTNVYSLPHMRGAKSAPGGAILNSEGGNLEQGGVQPIAPDPSLTVPKDKEAIPHYLSEEKVKIRKDYEQRRWQVDQAGKRFLVSPSTGGRIYEKEIGQ